MPAVKLLFPRSMNSQGYHLLRNHWKAVSAEAFAYFTNMAAQRPNQFQLDKNRNKDEAPAPTMRKSEAEMWQMFKRMMGVGNFDHTMAEPLATDLDHALAEQANVQALAPPADKPRPEGDAKPTTIEDAANMLDMDDEANFGADGRPTQLALSAKMGRIVKQEEIDALFPDPTITDQAKPGKKNITIKKKTAEAPEPLDTGASQAA